MRKKLLSAYELAQKRIIVSDYGDKVAERERRERAETYEVDALPDFVDAWERPDRGKSPPLLIEENEESKFYTKKDIESHNEKQRIEKQKVDEYMTPLQGKQTINFNEPPLEVHWYGNFTSYTGFSRQNRAMAFGLSNRNTIVKTDIQDSSMEINKSTQMELNRMSKNEIDPAAPKVYGCTIPLRLAHGGKKILYTMMETSETLHEGYVGRINLYDEIWVPTDQGAKLFKDNGVRPPIKVMPLGVDPIRYHPHATPMEFGFGLNDFVFLSVFKWGYRKGYDVLLKAYMEEFSSDDNVSLLIASRTDVYHKPEIIAQDFQAVRNGVLKDDSDLPHVALYDKFIKEKDMPRLYAAADAFVLISRGEGFGLPFCEAAASGLPVIGSNCSGQSDFLIPEGTYLVDPDSYSKAKINGNMSKLAKHCGFYEDQTFPDFGRDAIEKTKEHMRSIYEDYESAEVKAAILSKHIRENYTWDMAVDRVYNRLKEIS